MHANVRTVVIIFLSHTHTHMHCRFLSLSPSLTNTHTHTHTHNFRSGIYRFHEKHIFKVWGSAFSAVPRFWNFRHFQSFEIVHTFKVLQFSLISRKNYFFIFCPLTRRKQFVYKFLNQDFRRSHALPNWLPAIKLDFDLKMRSQKNRKKQEPKQTSTLIKGYSRRLTIVWTAVRSPCVPKAFYRILDEYSMITT